MGSPAKYVWGRKNCAIFAISRKQDANRVTVKGEHEVMATLPSKESVQRNKLETRAHRCRLDVHFASHLSVVVVVCSGESALCSVPSVTAGHVPRNGSFIAASPASRFTSRRLYFLCWRELSWRRLLPAVSPAAGHLTTPTVAGLPGLCEHFRPTTTKSSPI